MSNNEELAIDVEDLTFNFGESPVLENVTFKLQKGARCLLVGNFLKKMNSFFSKLIY